MDDLIPILAIFFVLGVPAVSLATHFVLRPLVKDIVEAMRASPSNEIAGLRQRIEEQERELAQLEARLERLADAETLHRRLEERPLESET